MFFLCDTEGDPVTTFRLVSLSAKTYTAQRKCAGGGGGDLVRSHTFKITLVLSIKKCPEMGLHRTKTAQAPHTPLDSKGFIDAKKKAPHTFRTAFRTRPAGRRDHLILAKNNYGRKTLTRRRVWRAGRD